MVVSTKFDVRTEVLIKSINTVGRINFIEVHGGNLIKYSVLYFDDKIRCECIFLEEELEKNETA
jgi:hypothetical protein